MKLWLKWLSVAAIVLLQACSDAPELAAIKKSLTEDLPTGWQLVDFKVEAEEEVGTKVEPVWRYRFTARIAPTETTYSRIGKLNDTDILKIAQKKKQKFTIHGIGQSALYGGNWRGYIRNFDPATEFEPGRLLTSFNKHVIYGSSDYKKLLKSTKKELDELEKQVLADTGLLEKKTAEYFSLNQELQQKVQLSNQNLRNLQEQVQQQRQQIQQETSSQQLSLSNQHQAERQQQTAVVKQEYDAKVAELEKQHRLKTAEYSAERTKAQQARTEERNKTRAAYNEDLQAKRQALARADYTVYKAQADEKLREDNAATDARYNARIAQIKEQETAQTNYRRTELNKYNESYQQQVNSINQQLTAQRDAGRTELSQQRQEATNKLDTELTAARQQHQALLNNNNSQLNSKRTELDQLQRKLSDNRNLLSRNSELIARLEREN